MTSSIVLFTKRLNVFENDYSSREVHVPTIDVDALLGVIVDFEYDYSNSIKRGSFVDDEIKSIIKWFFYETIDNIDLTSSFIEALQSAAKDLGRVILSELSTFRNNTNEHLRYHYDGRVAGYGIRVRRQLDDA